MQQPHAPPHVGERVTFDFLPTTKPRAFLPGRGPNSAPAAAANAATAAAVPGKRLSCGRSKPWRLLTAARTCSPNLLNGRLYDIPTHLRSLSLGSLSLNVYGGSNFDGDTVVGMILVG